MTGRSFTRYWPDTLIALLLVFCVSDISAQKEQDKNVVISQRLEAMAEDLDNEELDFTTVAEALSDYYDHPLNLNRCSAEELKQLGLLTDIQINNLVRHIENNGLLMTIYELQAVDGWTVNDIRRVMPFVRVARPVEATHTGFKELMANSSNTVFLRYSRVLEHQKGFNTDSSASHYNGSPDKLYLRYRFRYGTRISAGVTAEKDAGETFINGNNPYGFDFYSAHLFLRNKGILRQLALGDYQVQTAQGLACWSGLGFGKSPDILGVKKNPAVLKPYTSVDENRFMRGAAATVAAGDLSITGFFSSHKVDANVLSSDTTTDGVVVNTVSSLFTDGIHGTDAQEQDEDAISETNGGAYVAYHRPAFHVGATLLSSRWSGKGIDRDLSVYNQFEFEGNTNFNLSADYNAIVRNANFFGELARSASGGMAALNGLIISLDPRLQMTFLHRYYSRDYQAALSSGFGEGSKTSNESGIYTGFQSALPAHLTLTGYVDVYRFPWLRYQVNAPSHGVDYLLRTTWKPSKKLSIYIQYKDETKGRNTKAETTGIDPVVSVRKQQERLNVMASVSDALRLRSRVELVQYSYGSENRENGFLAFQDIMYKPLSGKIAFTFRYALFDTDSYDSRIYAYENDVLYAFYIPAYYYRGMRSQLTLQYKIRKGLDLWLRYAVTRYDNRNTVSSGLNAIDGNQKSELKAQVRVVF